MKIMLIAGASKEAIVRHSFEKLEKPEKPKRPKLWVDRAGDRIIEKLSAV